MPGSFDVDGITLDFYNTLVCHRVGRGRGTELMGFLRANGFSSKPWEHQVLYDVFEHHRAEYKPQASAEDRLAYYRRLAERVFHRLDVRAPPGAAHEHAEALWRLLGPASLSVFPEVPGVLRRLRELGYPLAVVSNWQHGLEHFCTELGLRDLVDHVLVSAELGSVKPDPGIFHEACRRLGHPPARVLHVGDAEIDDVEGGRGAGLQVVLLRRDRQPASSDALSSLDGLVELLS